MWTHRRSGQTNQRGDKDHRDAYERDKTRVIHCPAFRRLQRKTQILGTAQGDFHRTRLTHSLEVASIGSSIVRNLSLEPSLGVLGLLPHDDLINVICLLHDIGHPPFGHGGEVALNAMMHHHGGFEGNGQTFRLLTKIETSYGQYGLDLTRRSLLGLLKYPVNYTRVVKTKLPSIADRKVRINDWLPAKAYFDTELSEVNWLIDHFDDTDKALLQTLAYPPTDKMHGQSRFHSFDCSIMDIADDIAYGVHDLEDAIHLQLITREQLDTPDFRQLLLTVLPSHHPRHLLDSLFANELTRRKQAIGEMVNFFVTATKVIITDCAFNNALLKYNIALSNQAKALLDYLKTCIYTHVIDSQEARIVEHGGQIVIMHLFDALSANPNSLLDNTNRLLFREAVNESAAMRVICDYIANMTDGYAYRLHERLFGFNKTSFDQL